MCTILAQSAHAFPNADEVRAAFLFNFAKYSKWTEEALPKEAPEFRICVVGMPGITKTLEEGVGKFIKDKPLKVSAISTLQYLSNCHLIYWNEHEIRLPQDVRSALIRKGTLLVGEGAQTEGTIGFVEHENKIGFVVDLAIAREAGILMSAQLLKLAIETRGSVEESR